MAAWIEPMTEAVKMIHVCVQLLGMKFQQGIYVLYVSIDLLASYHRLNQIEEAAEEREGAYRENTISKAQPPDKYDLHLPRSGRDRRLGNRYPP
jgi:hypothetical protein